MEQYNYPLFNQDYILLDGGPNLGGCLSKKSNQQQQQAQHHHSHHQQSTTTTITTPECFLNDSFVDFSELHINSHLKGQACITTHIYQPNIAKRRTRQRRSRANRNSSKCSLKAQPRPRHGISSFQSFNVTSESVMSIRSIMEKQQNLVSARARRSAPPSSYIRKPSSRFVRMDKAAEKENLPKFSRKRGKFRPTILKGRRKGGKANKLRALNQGNSPIKTLTFSPSRFLNTSTLTAPEEITKQPPQGDVVKELSFDETPFDIEDSGIGGYEHELSEPLVPPSLTSTPISSRRRTGNKTCSDNKPFSDPEIELPFLDNSDCEELNWLLDSTASLSDNGAPEFPSKTLTSNASDSFFPGSSSYNFLDSDTDTTFCDIPTFSYDDLSSGFDPDDLNSINLYPLDFNHTPKAEARLDGSQLGKADNHHHHHQQNDSGTTKKSARKSLVLDDVVISSDSSSNSTLLKVPLKSSTTTTASNLLHSLHSKHEQSALVGSKMVMEKRVLAPGKKSVYLTRPRRLPHTAESLVFDQSFVQVACGRSHDQKAMTEAARRCLTSFRKRHYVK